MSEEVKPQTPPEKPTHYFNIDLKDKTRFQPVHFTPILGSYMALICKFDADEVKTDVYKLNSVEIKSKRIAGLVNMAVYRISGIRRGDPKNKEDENEVKITVDINVFSKKDKYPYFETDGFEIKKGDYFNVAIGEAYGLEDDDLSNKQGLDRDGFCFSTF
ncbi:hypothetical protein [uncultured Winogradskyella sp.]|uniref:hypothetical protein n=1 Tax=uncultured Winogradskyella sp. TaxID=395353 RepID=UPI0026167334|nr:hypothetical protein [uncultured Winogradskyella sp.]